MRISKMITDIATILILLSFVGYFYYDQIQVAPSFTMIWNDESIELMGEEGKFGVEKKS